MGFLSRTLATFFFTGYFPFAPATFASAVFCAVYFWLPGGEWLVHPVVVAATFIVSIPVSTYMEKSNGKDPSCVVIDEVVGMQIILVGVAAPSMFAVGAAFVLFRIFDIAKPYPIDKSQALPGGWGIVVDDALAGVFARAALVLVGFFVPELQRFNPW